MINIREHVHRSTQTICAAHPVARTPVSTHLHETTQSILKCLNGDCSSQ